jgi:hypothetical protein
MSDIPYQFQYEYPAEQPDPNTTYVEFFPPLGQMGGPNQPVIRIGLIEIVMVFMYNK